MNGVVNLRLDGSQKLMTSYEPNLGLQLLGWVLETIVPWLLLFIITVLPLFCIMAIIARFF